MYDVCNSCNGPRVHTYRQRCRQNHHQTRPNTTDTGLPLTKHKRTIIPSLHSMRNNATNRRVPAPAPHPHRCKKETRPGRKNEPRQACLRNRSWRKDVFLSHHPHAAATFSQHCAVAFDHTLLLTPCAHTAGRTCKCTLPTNHKRNKEKGKALV